MMTSSDHGPLPSGSDGPSPTVAGAAMACPGRVEVRGERVVACGEFDAANVGDLAAALEQVVRGGGCGFAVDLTEVIYLDSAGLRVLWDFLQYKPRLLVRAGSVPERVLTVAGFADCGLVEIAT